MKKFAHKDVWTSNLDDKLFIEIVHWGVDREDSNFQSLNYGKGCWNYYITLFEHDLPPELFKALWLEDEKIRFCPESPERITHDYMRASFNNVNWHGGVTYYNKLGQVEGHRGVKIGCDYSHLFDAERGYDYNLEEVIADALETAKQLKELYKL